MLRELTAFTREAIAATLAGRVYTFFTDGGFNARAQITALMRTVSAFPAFWQFIGIGKSSCGIRQLSDPEDEVPGPHVRHWSDRPG
ncbi:VWA domain-containing protein [Rhodococcus oxybenzonivorans]|uniref:VWA domain-containing protein n=1 Tax=Rhodococcus TaxID=1827 RepID=UPI0013204760|nr:MULTISPECIES: VWA domain-containing protein [Rhodococcus]MDV7352187.1 VWA domain-containing protein [Rhodococcus oxybenzonivorans]QHE72382.1 hypothetical protein GFS60_06022 [Rhodococcus sp. WAY2]